VLTFVPTDNAIAANAIAKTLQLSEDASSAANSKHPADSAEAGLQH